MSTASAVAAENHADGGPRVARGPPSQECEPTNAPSDTGKPSFEPRLCLPFPFSSYLRSSRNQADKSQHSLFVSDPRAC